MVRLGVTDPKGAAGMHTPSLTLLLRDVNIDTKGWAGRGFNAAVGSTDPGGVRHARPLLASFVDKRYQMLERKRF